MGVVLFGQLGGVNWNFCKAQRRWPNCQRAFQCDQPSGSAPWIFNSGALDLL